MSRRTLEPTRIPDRIFIGIALVLYAGTVIGSVILYPSLPARIPIHFNLWGTPDGFAATSPLSFFFPAIIQGLVSALLLFAYQHPQYANLPTPVQLTTMPAAQRTKLVWLIRHMLAVLLVILNCLFSYLMVAISGVALGTLSGLNGWLMGSIVLVMLCLIIGYSIVAVRWSRPTRP